MDPNHHFLMSGRSNLNLFTAARFLILMQLTIADSQSIQSLLPRQPSILPFQSSPLDITPTRLDFDNLQESDQGDHTLEGGTVPVLADSDDSDDNEDAPMLDFSDEPAPSLVPSAEPPVTSDAAPSPPHHYPKCNCKPPDQTTTETSRQHPQSLSVHLQDCCASGCYILGIIFTNCGMCYATQLDSAMC